MGPRPGTVPRQTQACGVLWKQYFPLRGRTPVLQLRDGTAFNFTCSRTLRTVCHGGCASSCPRVPASPCPPTSLPTPATSCAVDLSRSDGCGVMSPGGFDLHLPDDRGCCTTFHVSVAVGASPLENRPAGATSFQLRGLATSGISASRVLGIIPSQIRLAMVSFAP